MIMSNNLVQMQMSFEFFPPQTETALQTLIQISKQLATHNPTFFSVTYGAGGSTQERTTNTVTTLIKHHSLSIAPHISCIGNTKEKIANLLTQYKDIGINRLVALRGDLPSGLGTLSGDFKYACDLVAFIREQTKHHFHIEVAVYPECHPESQNLQNDLLHFKEKVAAGANSAITQYFYNADAYENLLNQCTKFNIQIPIIPGIMPITNYVQIARFSNICGAEIPKWLKKSLESYQDDLASIRQFGIEVVSRLCERLISLGAPGLHFYTLNHATACQEILKNLS